MSLQFNLMNTHSAEDGPDCDFECRFDLVATAHAGLLPRALETVARMDIAPQRCVAETDERERMTVSLTFRGLTADQARTASERMRGIFGVETVALSLTPLEQTWVPAVQAGA